MKNKKIISRVLAIFAVLVLMVSMALPAFADEEAENLEAWEQVYYTYNSGYGNIAFDEMFANDFGESNIVTSSDLVLFTIYQDVLSDTHSYNSIHAILNSDSQIYVEGYVGYGYGEVILTSIDGDLYSSSVAEIGFTCFPNIGFNVEFYDREGYVVLGLIYLLDPSDDGSYYCNTVTFRGDEFVSPQVQSIDVAFITYDDTACFVDDFYRTLTDDAFYRFSPRSFYDGMFLSNRPDGVVPPSRTGMFGQIYYILYDAIYGSDAVIGTSQDFVLTQIATWMTYIVILLPLLVVAIFLWRVFAR